jgi:tripartite-type tricarboxylate transporter receptor subunit TctC
MGHAVKHSRRTFLHLTAGAAALPVLPRIAWSLDYPSRPVRVLVGFPAGSGPDVIARLIGQRLADRLGRQFVVEDRSGAGSSLAAEAVAAAAPDGYTLLLAANANAVNASLYPNLPFNFVHDIAAVAMICSAPFLLVANPAMPVKTLPEFIDYAKANPGKINMASPGVGTTPHLMYELLRMMTGVELVHVPYRTGYIPDLLSGQVQVAFSTITQAIPYVRANRLRALAVSSAARSEVLPDVPAVGEFVPGYDASGWFGICAPKATPAAIIDKLNREINAIVAETGTRTRLVGLGVRPLSMTSAQFGKLIADDTEKWAKVIRSANIKTD